MCKDHIPNFIPVALIVFEFLVHRQTDTQTDIIPKLCFSDSGRSKTWRFVKISSSNFLTITVLSLCILRKRESKKGNKKTILLIDSHCIEHSSAHFYLLGTDSDSDKEAADVDCN
ncbi:hypothetical protein AVEN_2598-1 [Araneus ventricosus]|uniref:Uncharacterized protein n=1 Tax=Araneus ventricosus TaxID=182803 RepID=A0A4Y2SWP6_ARAVE|nr:hypothetical protein AVEN_189356-1 [Araneus ventricosus]GBN91295.1 hypothetical protein AVEN_2598-1 [Araneus ventricosus]